ncbi:hypothetical protein GHT06_008779 [Daphnia sinensis]|uniref:Uncharacterized protein n=1 Tax=Daphnia sinensis TaxID=1820382 RepID=A0AAD5Q335_9CRUS|nr:hypothetical protein GHT06_008779 [Daphnia sinensis]
MIQLVSSFEENMGKLQAIVSQQPSSHFSSTPTRMSASASSSPRGNAFYSPAELAEYSRTGKVCPTKPGTMPKKKFPEDILNAITGFITSRWSTWHDGSVMEEATVHAAVGHRLLGCHTNTSKRKMRQHPDVNEDEVLNEELSRTIEPGLGL